MTARVSASSREIRARKKATCRDSQKKKDRTILSAEQGGRKKRAVRPSGEPQDRRSFWGVVKETTAGESQTQGKERGGEGGNSLNVWGRNDGGGRYLSNGKPMGDGGGQRIEK